MKKILGLVGMPAAGKSTALEIAQEFGEIVVMGDIIREEAKNRGLDINSDTLGRIALELREKEGPTAVANRCIQKIQKSSAPVIFIDGIRSIFEVETFKNCFSIEIIAIIAPDKLRHKWLMARGRADDSLILDEIINRDNRELKLGVGEVIKIANYQINNISTIEELKINLKKIFREVIDHD